MELKYQVTGTQRKELVSIISKIVGQRAVYQYTPTYAFVIGSLTVDRYGTLLWDERTSDDTIAQIRDGLAKAGFQADSAEETLCTSISMPREQFTEQALENLRKLVEAKGSLMKKAFATDSLAIEVSEERVSFPWFSADDTPETMQAHAVFVEKLCRLVQTQKWVSVKEKPIDNEKYAFRCFLLRLGFIGTEYKTERKILLRNLTGSSAFKSGSKKEAEHDVSQ